MPNQVDFEFGPWYDLIPQTWPIGSMEAEEEIPGGPNIHVPLKLGTSGRQVLIAGPQDIVIGYSYAAGNVAEGDYFPVIFAGPVLLMRADVDECRRGEYVVPSATAGRVFSQAVLPTDYMRCGLALTDAEEDELCAVLTKHA